MRNLITLGKSALLLTMVMGIASFAYGQKTYLKNAVYLNGGQFGGSPTASIGGYNPAQENYQHFDSIYVNSVQDIAIDSVQGDRAYLAAQDTLIFYELNNQSRINKKPISQLKWLHATKDLLFVGKMNFPTRPSPFVESYFTLSLGNSGFGLDSFYDNVNDMAVTNNTAYVSHNIEKTTSNEDSLGYLAVYDLGNQTYTKEIDLGEKGAGIEELYSYNGKIYGLAKESNQLVTYNPSNDNVSYADIGVNRGLGLYDGILYGQFFDSGIGTYDVTNNAFIDSSLFDPTQGQLSLRVAEYDTLTDQFFIGKTDFIEEGAGFVYDENGNRMDSFAINVSPEAIAFHYKTNQAPMATTDYDTVKSGSIQQIDVIGNDTDQEGQNLNLNEIVKKASKGKDSIADNAVHYQANLNATGNDTLRYVVCDAVGACDTGMLILTIEANNAPQANTDYDTVRSGEYIHVAVLDNDNEPDGENLTLNGIVRNADHGTDSIKGDSIYYKPDDAYIGNDSIHYQVCDEYNTCDTGTVMINVWETTNTDLVTEHKNLKVYPNPFEEQIKVKLSGEASNGQGRIEIQNMEGRSIMTKTISNGNLTVDLAHLQSGVYLLQIETENTTSIQKIIKQ